MGDELRPFLTVEKICDTIYSVDLRINEAYITELDSNVHSVFRLNYPLILVIKYRKRVLNDEISNRAKEIFSYICPNYNIALQEWNHDFDHVHILFKAHPNTEISKFINAYKSASSIFGVKASACFQRVGQI